MNGVDFVCKCCTFVSHSQLLCRFFLFFCLLFAEVGGEQNAAEAAATRLDAKLKVEHDLYRELLYLFIYLFFLFDGGRELEKWRT